MYILRLYTNLFEVRPNCFCESKNTGPKNTAAKVSILERRKRIIICCYQQRNGNFSFYLIKQSFIIFDMNYCVVWEFDCHFSPHRMFITKTVVLWLCNKNNFIHAESNRIQHDIISCLSVPNFCYATKLIIHFKVRDCL